MPPRKPQGARRGKIVRFSRLGLLGRRYYFRPVGRNGEPLGQSEGYNSPSARDHGMEAARQVFIHGDVVDE